MTRICSDCSREIGSTSKTGRCKSCAMRAINADPAIVARRTVTNRAIRQTPEFRQRHSERCSAAKQRTMADPAVVERMREAGRAVGARNFWAANTPEAREKAVAAIKRTHLAWCPEPYWPLNAELKAAGIRLADRKAAVRQQIETEAARAVEGIRRAMVAKHARRQAEAY